MKKKTKKRMLPKLSSQMKETIDTLQKQADEITTTSFVPPLPKTNETPLPGVQPGSFIFVKDSSSEPLGYTMMKDYSVMFDCAAVVMFAGGFTSLGIYLGRML